MTEETPAERAEAAATRRRWISLAEIVAVVGVVIAALGLWNSWSDRRDDAAAKAAAAQTETRLRSRADLTAAPRDGGRELLIADTIHPIRDVVVTWPAALGVAPQRPPGDPVIAVAPVEAALLKATDGGADDRAGRVPVLIETSFVDGDTIRRDRATYDVVWRTEGRLLRGRGLRFEGLRLRERGGSPVRLTAIWATEARR